MRFNFLYLVILAALVITTSACDRSGCSNTNPIFDANTPETEVYKQELVNELHRVDKSQLTYWLQKYEEEAGTEYLYFRVQGDGLCAIMVVTMENWKGLKLVQEKKGDSYLGAEFVGLEYEVKSEYDHTEFLYRSIDHTVD